MDAAAEAEGQDARVSGAPATARRRWWSRVRRRVLPRGREQVTVDVRGQDQDDRPYGLMRAASTRSPLSRVTPFMLLRSVTVQNPSADHAIAACRRDRLGDGHSECRRLPSVR